MHASVDTWARRMLTPEVVYDARVLEVGAYDVNGSIRPYVESLGPKQYVATDMRKGPGVDVVLRAEQLPVVYRVRAFDIVICLEALEHMTYWRTCLLAMLDVLDLGGLLLLTTRSRGFAYHPEPGDYWRFDHRDWRAPSIPWEVVDCQPDPHCPGMFFAARLTGVVQMEHLLEIRATHMEVPT